MKHVPKDEANVARTSELTVESALKLGRKRHRRWTAEEKAGYLAQFARSGRSALAFSEETGVPYSSFCQWRQQARSEGERTGSGRFAEVHVAACATSTVATVYFGQGCRLEPPVGIDPQWVGAVIQAVG